MLLQENHSVDPAAFSICAFLLEVQKLSSSHFFLLSKIQLFKSNWFSQNWLPSLSLLDLCCLQQMRLQELLHFSIVLQHWNDMKASCENKRAPFSRVLSQSPQDRFYALVELVANEKSKINTWQPQFTTLLLKSCSMASRFCCHALPGLSTCFGTPQVWPLQVLLSEHRLECLFQEHVQCQNLLCGLGLWYMHIWCQNGVCGLVRWHQSLSQDLKRRQHCHCPRSYALACQPPFPTRSSKECRSGTLWHPHQPQPRMHSRLWELVAAISTPECVHPIEWPCLSGCDLHLALGWHLHSTKEVHQGQGHLNVEQKTLHAHESSSDIAKSPGTTSKPNQDALLTCRRRNPP